MRYSNILLGISLFGLSIAANAATCDDPEASELVRIYYVNGMFSESNVEDSKNNLRATIGAHSSRTFGFSVNKGEKFLNQIFQVFEQKSNEPPEVFWKYALNVLQAPEWFKTDYANTIRSAATVNYFTDADLRKMIIGYLEDLWSGKKVVLVSHSQGNFYANSAYAYIQTNYPQYQNSIGLVSVGSPSDRVQDGGPHTNNEYDYIIYDIVDTLYDVLPPTGRYDQPWDALNHGFVKTYLRGFGGKIRTDVLNTINRLSTPPKAEECKSADETAVSIDTTTASSITVTSARLNGRVLSGKNIDVWARWKAGSAPVSCASSASGYDGTGTFNTGDNPYVYTSSSGPLLADQTYYYRMCAKGTRNRVSDGGAVQFKTGFQALGLKTRTPSKGVDYADIWGQVTAGRATRVWFVVNRWNSSSTPGCSGGDYNIAKSGSFSAGDSFNIRFNDLWSGVPHKYRLCGRDSRGNTIPGPTGTFTTNLRSCGRQYAISCNVKYPHSDSYQWRQDYYSVPWGSDYIRLTSRVTKGNRLFYFLVQSNGTTGHYIEDWIEPYNTTNLIPVLSDVYQARVAVQCTTNGDEEYLVTVGCP